MLEGVREKVKLVVKAQKITENNRNQLNSKV